MGAWSQSQLTLGEGGVHSGQVSSSLQGWHIEKNHSRSHSHLRAPLDSRGKPDPRRHIQPPYKKVLPRLGIVPRTLLMWGQLSPSIENWMGKKSLTFHLNSKSTQRVLSGAFTHIPWPSSADSWLVIMWPKCENSVTHWEIKESDTKLLLHHCTTVNKHNSKELKLLNVKTMTVSNWGNLRFQVLNVLSNN